MNTIGDYGFAGAVLAIVLWIFRKQTKFMQNITEHTIKSQITVTEYIKTKYEDDLSKISATLIIIQDREDTQSRLQEKIAECQMQIATCQKQILDNQRAILDHTVKGS
jgi:hypothetical protein